MLHLSYVTKGAKYDNILILIMVALIGESRMLKEIFAKVVNCKFD